MIADNCYLFVKGFTIVKITTPAGKIGKCIEFTTGSQVKYALKVVTTTNIIFEVSRYQNNVIKLVGKKSKVKLKTGITLSPRSYSSTETLTCSSVGAVKME